VHRLRDDVIPRALATCPAPQVYVGGQTAMFIDLSDQSASRLPWFVGRGDLLSVLLLMMVFRSVAVPLKAAAMNLLSIGAAYGIIVAVFQWGWLNGVIGAEDRADRLVHADDAVRHPVRAVDGLRGVPADPGARGVPRPAATTTPP
jgi:uncharacterized membrane protein YdfJ with MMPL/SSD domain